MQLYIIIIIIILECIMYKILANCSIQHCTTHAIQTHHILGIKSIKATQLKVGGGWQQMMQITSSTFCQLSSPLPYLYKLYP